MSTLPCIVPNHHCSYESFSIDVRLLRLTMSLSCRESNYWKGKHRLL